MQVSCGLTLARERIVLGLWTFQKSKNFTYKFRLLFFFTPLEKLENPATGSPHSNMAALLGWPQSPLLSNVFY